MGQAAIGVRVDLLEDVLLWGHLNVILLDVDQFYIKVQSRPARDVRARPAGPVAKGRRDRQHALLADAHIKEALVPSLDIERQRTGGMGGG